MRSESLNWQTSEDQLFRIIKGLLDKIICLEAENMIEE